MVAIGKKKYQSGEGAQFLTRRAALKKLQLSFKDFRKLCIIKGIYPREPRNRKRAQKGKPGISTLYHVKDIQFLLHEPIIWKLREYKIFSRKVGRAKAMKDFAAMKRFLSNHPTLKLDHIVKERYPTFMDALRDLDDCLTLCFLFSTFPSLSHIPRDQSILCRKLTTEFIHAVIAGRALRKVFVSIKGFYYQAEIKGQTVTWIVPHNFSFQPQSRSEVDFTVMSTFVEFYITMLGFVNFRLYHSLNLFYPPKLTVAGVDSERALVDEDAYIDERVAALSVPLIPMDASVEVEEEADEFPVTDHEDAEKFRLEAEKKKKLKNLFKDLKFFINREVPRQELVFSILAFGGKVSWDKTLFVGATFDENDESITHQIVDRSAMEKRFLSRYYVQPQWVFDSINAMELLPVEQYLMGAILPPHLSPFNNQLDQTYIPPEERAMRDPSYKMTNWQDEDEDDEENEGEENQEDEEEKEGEHENEGEEEVEEEEEEDDGDKEKLRMKKKKNMKVKPGEVVKEDPWAKAKQEKQEFRLREKMIPKKHRGLYKSMVAGREKRAKEIWLLKKKRRLHDEEAKKTAKAARKAKKAEN